MACISICTAKSAGGNIQIRLTRKTATWCHAHHVRGGGWWLVCCKRDPWIYEEVNFKFRKIPISIKIQLLPRGRANLLLGSFIASHPWGVKEVKFIYTHSSDITASRDVKEFKCWFKKYATQLIRKQIALLLNFHPEINPWGWVLLEEDQVHRTSLLVTWTLDCLSFAKRIHQIVFIS